ncbi:nucleoside deaminase [Psychrobacter sp. AOP22-C1-22]|uniref:nucleoside deaminase n=1 Tax=unclassified Psychrobacter TaxID=196806 RepID=UPI0017881858|nr:MULTISPECIES: nucleoside deaminase [unclassified Psychrobacter]MBE0405991.1 nucleoside deaminase [Psychrobacter sp. FME6]MBE0446307.1 nucleoside deaminase [Psychrobacter sp. FME5]MDN5802693.1 nucleoside deaminase [Psychrobacter sp.]MDN5892138.1 nucleoside deaminase [Psychrobacter sp.]
MTTDNDMIHLRRCVELAAEALEAGDEPFGSVLVDADGQVLREDRNRANSVDATYHPEIAVAKWAAENMTADARTKAVVYTSGEHCAMCSAAHAWAGLGRIVYVSSSKQLGEWMDEMGVKSSSPINSLSIQEVAPDVAVEGPIAGLDEEVKALQQRSFQKG